MSANPYDDIRELITKHEQLVLAKLAPVIDAVPEEVRETVRAAALKTGARMAIELLCKSRPEAS